MDILRSQSLVNFYRQKIESMIRKTFLIDMNAAERQSGKKTEEPKKFFSLVQNKLVKNSKKPKTALSICQFRQAIQVAIETLEKLIKKYGVQLQLN